MDGLLRSVAMRMSAPGATVEDLWQECRVAVIEALPRFDGRVKLSTWAGDVAKWAILRYRRDRGGLIRGPAWRYEAGDREDLAAHSLSELEDVDYEPAGAHDPRAAIDGRIWVEQMLSRLSARQRQVMALVIEGLSDREISRAIGICAQGVGRHRAAAIYALRRLCDDGLERPYAGGADGNELAAGRTLPAGHRG